MNLIGYGVLSMGKPCGIWPRPWVSAMRKARKEQTICADVQVVPVYVGTPIDIVTPPIDSEKEKA